MLAWCTKHRRRLLGLVLAAITAVCAEQAFRVPSKVAKLLLRIALVLPLLSRPHLLLH